MKRPQGNSIPNANQSYFNGLILKMQAKQSSSLTKGVLEKHFPMILRGNKPNLERYSSGLLNKFLFYTKSLPKTVGKTCPVNSKPCNKLNKGSGLGKVFSKKRFLKQSPGKLQIYTSLKSTPGPEMASLKRIKSNNTPVHNANISTVKPV